jgi:hypothetical protein
MWTELDTACENIIQKGGIGEDSIRRLFDDADASLKQSLGDITFCREELAECRIDDEFLCSNITNMRDKHRTALEKMMNLSEPYSPFSCTISTDSRADVEQAE